MEDIKLLYIDLFCGAGGTSTGVEKAKYKGKKCAKVIACVNHDANAIASHAANHSDALHFTKDIRTLELTPLVLHVEKMKAVYPKSLVILHASLECTNFSKAKGGLSRNPDSRTLAEHLYRYIEVINPDFIQIENVEEFLDYGPVELVIKKTEEGYECCPLEKVKRKETEEELRIRKSNKKRKFQRYHYLPVYKPIKELKTTYYNEWRDRIESYGYKYEYKILNAADYGAYTSRKRYFGIFAKGELPVTFPNPTHSKTGSKKLSGSTKKWKPVKDVLNFSDDGESVFARKVPLSDKTLERIYAGLIKFIAGGKNSVQGKFISCYCGNKNNQRNSVYSVENPSPTVTVFERLSLVSVNFIVNEYSGGGQHSSIDEACPAILTTPKQKVVSCKFLMDTTFKESPMPTITVHRKQHYIMNPQYSNVGCSVEKPCFTIIARMDKKPPYLISTETGQRAIEVYDTDTEPMRRIKEFMTLYGIVDIKMRMLKINELKRIMGFPQDYILRGTQSEQKKYIGNAVEVNMARALCEALVTGLYEVGFFRMAA
jgi:DNA (cytosine-5)-methyltransferase 1